MDNTWQTIAANFYNSPSEDNESLASINNDDTTSTPAMPDSVLEMTNNNSNNSHNSYNSIVPFNENDLRKYYIMLSSANRLTPPLSATPPPQTSSLPFSAPLSLSLPTTLPLLSPPLTSPPEASMETQFETTDDSNDHGNCMELCRKVEIIREYEKFPEFNLIGEMFCMPPEYIKNIIDQKKSILSAWQHDDHECTSIWLQEINAAKIGKVVYEWLRRTIFYKQFSVTDNVLLKMALKFKAATVYKNFDADQKWCDTFRATYKLYELDSKKLSIGHTEALSVKVVDVIKDVLGEKVLETYLIKDAYKNEDQSEQKSLDEMENRLQEAADAQETIPEINQENFEELFDANFDYDESSFYQEQPANPLEEPLILQNILSMPPLIPITSKVGPVVPQQKLNFNSVDKNPLEQGTANSSDEVYLLLRPVKTYKAFKLIEARDKRTQIKRAKLKSNLATATEVQSSPAETVPKKNENIDLGPLRKLMLSTPALQVTISTPPPKIESNSPNAKNLNQREIASPDISEKIPKISTPPLTKQRALPAITLHRPSQDESLQLPPIKTFKEARRYLRLLEVFALDRENFRLIGLLTCVEDALNTMENMWEDDEIDID